MLASSKYALHWLQFWNKLLVYFDIMHAHFRARLGRAGGLWILWKYVIRFFLCAVLYNAVNFLAVCFTMIISFVTLFFWKGALYNQYIQLCTILLNGLLFMVQDGDIVNIDVTVYLNVRIFLSIMIERAVSLRDCFLNYIFYFNLGIPWGHFKDLFLWNCWCWCKTISGGLLSVFSCHVYVFGFRFSCWM